MAQAYPASDISGTANHATDACLSRADEPAVLADIYEEDVRIAVWRRELHASLAGAITDMLARRRNLNLAITVKAQDARAQLAKALGPATPDVLCSDISVVVDMFCCLFDLGQAGLRLSIVRKAMCPRFHVDRVACRLVTTYAGAATQWLPDHCANRAELGCPPRNASEPDLGLYTQASDIQQLSCGDIALLKGELWEGNEGAGLIHRSPAVPAGDSRLVMTLDIVS